MATVRSGEWKGEDAGQKIWIKAQTETIWAWLKLFWSLKVSIIKTDSQRWWLEGLRQYHRIKPNFIHSAILKIAFCPSPLMSHRRLIIGAGVYRHWPSQSEQKTLFMLDFRKFNIPQKMFFYILMISLLYSACKLKWEIVSWWLLQECW